MEAILYWRHLLPPHTRGVITRYHQAVTSQIILKATNVLSVLVVGQNPDAQASELRAAGATRVFIVHGKSSRTSDRAHWQACLDVDPGWEHYRRPELMWEEALVV